MMLDEKETGALRSCLDRLHSCIKGKRGCPDNSVLLLLWNFWTAWFSSKVQFECFLLEILNGFVHE